MWRSLRCSCAAAPRIRKTGPVQATRFASTSTLPPPDALILAAKRHLQVVAEMQDGSIEAAKRKREVEGLQKALLDVEEGEEVCCQ